MSGLIPSTKFSLSTELLENPFPTLFLVNLPANLPLVGKAEYLKELSVALSNLETLTEDTFNRNHWGSIASGFSAAITIAGSASLVPVVGWILSGVSVVAAAASIGGAVHTKSKVSPVIETLKRHRLALESQEAIQWAALWELVGTDLFCRSLGYASRGVVSGGKLVQQGDDSPFMRAVDFIAECRGMGYEQVITSAGAIKNSTQPAPVSEPKVSNLPTPAVGQNTKLLAIETEATVVQEQSFVKAQPTPVDIALEMAKVPKSTIIAASPRVGKGVVVSIALAHLRQLHPDLEIWLIDPKNEPTELHYWSLIDPDKRCHFDLRDFDVDVEAAVEVFSEHLIRFNRSPSPRKLLIIDEFVTLNQKCAGVFMNQLKDFVVGICSSGEVNPDMGIGRFVWAITQSPYVSDLGFKTKAALATFQRVFLLSKASINLYQLAVSASFVPAGFEQKLNRLLEATGRIFYYSRTDSWHPIPIYNLPKSSTDNELREKLEGLLPKTSQRPCSHPEAPGSSGSSSKNSEAPEAPREEALPGLDEWRKYFPEAPEVVEEALFGAYQKALEVEGGKKKFVSEILKAGTGGRKYQAASAYVDYLTQKFGSSK